MTQNFLNRPVGQGVIGVEYWTGQTVDAAVMRDALEEILSRG